MIARPRPAALLPALGLLLLVGGVLALASGPAALSPRQVWQALSGGGDLRVATVVLDIRLPRVALAIAIGAVLAVSGAVVQALLRNPLAEPGLLGISSGAALAAAAVIVLAPALHAAHWAIPVAAAIGAALAALAVLALGSVSPLQPAPAQLLAGIAVNALCGAGLGVLGYVADDVALRGLTFWMFGSLGNAGWPVIAAFAAALPAVLVAAAVHARTLDLMQLGDAPAACLGVPVGRLRLTLLAAVVVSVGAATALAGIIGFVGLVVPHLLRLCGVVRHRWLLPGSALCGALLLLAADTAGRTLMAPAELPVGLVTALIGAPCFVALLLRGAGARRC